MKTSTSTQQYSISNTTKVLCLITRGGRRGRDRMVVGFTTTLYAISAYQH